jgi:hypothetical protein
MNDEPTPLSLHLTLAGTTGLRSAQELLAPLKAYLGTGTIIFAHLSHDAGIPSLRGATLLAVVAGEVKARRMLGRFDGLASTGITFAAHAHHANELPHLPAASETGWGVLRAAPQIVPASHWPAIAADLPTLHRRLEALGWSGLLAVGEGGALWREGRVVAAHADGAVGAEALRALRRAANEEAALLELHPLDPRTASSLHGVAERQRDSNKQAGSVHCDPDRTLYLGRNSAEFVVAGGSGFKGSFSAADRLASEPLHLPDEPIGWEGNRYAITLRGRDALNPMTDRHTSFLQRFGERGRTLLEAVGSGEALDKVGRAAGVEFPELRKLVEMWEGDGVVRRV